MRKTILFTLTASLVLCFSSCKKDEQNPILGSWKYDSYTVETLSTTDPVLTAMITQGLPLMAAQMQGLSFTFNADGSGLYAIPGRTEALDYLYSNGTLRYKYRNYDDWYAMPVTISGNMMIINYDVTEDVRSFVEELYEGSGTVTEVVVNAFLNKQ